MAGSAASCVQCQLRNYAASVLRRCGRRRALARFEAARRRRPVPLLPNRRRRGWKLTRAQPGHSLRSPQSAAVMSSTARRSCHMVTGRAAGTSRYASHGGRGQLSRQRRTLVLCVLVRVLRREELPIYAVMVHSCSSRMTTACGSEYMAARRSRNDYFRTRTTLCLALSGS